MLTLQPSASATNATYTALSSFAVAASGLARRPAEKLGKFTLRALTPRDWPIIRYVSFAMAYDDLSVLSDEDGVVLTKPAREWQKVTRALAHPSNTYWIVEEGDTPVGSLYVRVCTPEVGEIGNVWVAPRYRRRGLAGCLIDAAIRRLRAQQIRSVRLNVSISNQGAQLLYRQRGFAPTGQITRTLQGTRYREYVAALGETDNTRVPRATRRLKVG